MESNKHKEGLTIREIEYSIRISDKDPEFHELDSLLRAELTRFEDTRKRSNIEENPIQKFLRTNIERSVVIRDSTKVYFLNFQEKGSLTIKFNLLVITRYINYGSIRQALDFLIKDTIAGYFEELLERHVPVSVSVSADDHELYEIPLHLAPIEKPAEKKQRDYLSISISGISLLLVLILISILLFRENSAGKKIIPGDEYKDKYFELFIEKQIRESFEKEKYNYLFYKNIESFSDSTLRQDQK